jgi:hypothetical protein
MKMVVVVITYIISSSLVLMVVWRQEMNDAEFFLLMAADRLQRRIPYTTWAEVEKRLKALPRTEQKLLYVRHCLFYLIGKNEENGAESPSGFGKP